MDPIQSITRKAIALLIIATLGGAWFGGFFFGVGVLCSGCLMIGSLAFAAWLTRPNERGRYTLHRFSLLFSVKSPLVVFGIIILLLSFDPLAVVIGGSVLIFAITIDSVIRLQSPTRNA